MSAEPELETLNSQSAAKNTEQKKRRSKNKAEKLELKLIEERLNCRADLKLKLLIVGSSLVGKTSLVSRFDNRESKIDNLKQTLPGDFHLFSMPVGDNRNAHVRVWDMGGMEKLHEGDQLAPFYADINAVMLVFALDNYESFRQLPDWLNRIGRLSTCCQCQQQHPEDQQESLKPKQLAPCQHIDCNLVGNKVDLADKRLISTKEADEFARHYGMPYLETSAQNVDNVHKAFFDLVLAAAQRCRIEQDNQQSETVHGGKRRRHQRLVGLKALCCSCTAGRDGA